MILAAISSQYIGFVAGILTSVSMFPQLLKILKEKKADDLSVPMLLILIAGVSLWIYYGIQKDDPPIIYTNSLSLALNLTTLFLRFRYAGNKK